MAPRGPTARATEAPASGAARRVAIARGMHGGVASDGARVAAAADADLDALLLGGPDALLLDFWAEGAGAPAGALRGCEAEGPESGVDAPLQPPPLRCLDASHAPGCARCVVRRGAGLARADAGGVCAGAAQLRRARRGGR